VEAVLEVEDGMANEELKQAADKAFLALVLWREARGEPFPARVAVACSVMNRVLRPAWWGRSVLEVLFKKWQYSSVTDPHDPQLTTWPIGTEQSWLDCLQIAHLAVEGQLQNPVPGADSYYDTSIPAPKWATEDCFVAQLGKLRFYDVDHDYQRSSP
jgi:spore germination cell wall hydrolase CwlJ-like protein